MRVYKPAKLMLYEKHKSTSDDQQRKCEITHFLAIPEMGRLAS